MLSSLNLYVYHSFYATGNAKLNFCLDYLGAVMSGFAFGWQQDSSNAAVSAGRVPDLESSPACHALFASHSLNISLHGWRARSRVFASEPCTQGRRHCTQTVLSVKTYLTLNSIRLTEDLV